METKTHINYNKNKKCCKQQCYNYNYNYYYFFIWSRGALHTYKAKRRCPELLEPLNCMSPVKGTEDREVRPSRQIRVVVPVICSVALINSVSDRRSYPMHSKMVNSQEMAWSLTFILF